MITVTISKEQSGRIHSFEMKGHANYAERGKDLVCAGATSVAFGAINAIDLIIGETPKIKQGANGGYLQVVFPDSPEKNHDIQLIIKTMIVSLQMIELDYGEHIQINFQ